MLLKTASSLRRASYDKTRPAPLRARGTGALFFALVAEKSGATCMQPSITGTMPRPLRRAGTTATPSSVERPVRSRPPVGTWRKRVCRGFRGAVILVLRVIRSSRFVSFWAQLYCHSYSFCLGFVFTVACMCVPFAFLFSSSSNVVIYSHFFFFSSCIESFYVYVFIDGNGITDGSVCTIRANGMDGTHEEGRWNRNTSFSPNDNSIWMVQR